MTEGVAPIASAGSPFAVPRVMSEYGRAEFRVDEATMNDTPQRPPLPDHLSVDPRSPHHVAAVFEHDIGIRLNDK
jgi:hypothetical protein